MDRDDPVTLDEIEAWLAGEPGATLIELAGKLCPIHAPEGVLDLGAYVGAVARACPSYVLDALPSLWGMPVVGSAVTEIVREHSEAVIAQLAAPQGSKSGWYQYLSRLPDDLVLAYLCARGEAMHTADADRLLELSDVRVPEPLHRRLIALVNDPAWRPRGPQVNAGILDREQLAALFESAEPEPARALLADIASQGYPHGLDVIAAQTAHPEHGDAACLALALSGSDGQRALRRYLADNPAREDQRLTTIAALPERASAFANAYHFLPGRELEGLVGSYRVSPGVPPAVAEPTDRATVKKALRAKSPAQKGLSPEVWCDCLQVLSFTERVGEIDLAYDRALAAGVLGRANDPAALAAAVDRLDWTVTRRKRQFLWNILSWCEAPLEVFVHAASHYDFFGCDLEMEKPLAKIVSPSLAKALADLPKELRRCASETSRRANATPWPELLRAEGPIGDGFEAGHAQASSASVCVLTGIDEARLRLRESLEVHLSMAEHTCRVSLKGKQVASAPLCPEAEPGRATITVMFVGDAVEIHAGPSRIYAGATGQLGASDAPIRVEAKGPAPRASVTTTSFQPRSLAGAARFCIIWGGAVDQLGQYDSEDTAGHLAAIALLSPDEEARAEAEKQLRMKREHAARARALVGMDVDVAPPPEFTLRAFDAVLDALGDCVRRNEEHADGRIEVGFEVAEWGGNGRLVFHPGPRPSPEALLAESLAGAELDVDAWAIRKPGYDLISYVALHPSDPEDEDLSEDLLGGIPCGVVGAFDVEGGHARIAASTPLMTRVVPESVINAISMPAHPSPFAWEPLELPHG